MRRRPGRRWSRVLAPGAAAAWLALAAPIGAAIGAERGVVTRSATPAAHAPPPAGGLLDFSADERRRIAAHGPWPPPVERDIANRVEGRPAAIRLGRALFFDTRLAAPGSAGAALACASCHVPERAFQDGAPLARGRAMATRRNTPSLLDVAQQRWFGWDGASDSLWAASLAPLLSPNEMAADAASAAARVREHAPHAAAYRAAFGRDATDDRADVLLVNLAKALAAYQATLVSPRTPFDRFRDALARGDWRAAARYPMDAQRGLRLFVGRARCSVCHAGPAFTNREFADIGVPFFTADGVDPGRHGGISTLRSGVHHRLGPFNDAGEAADPRALLTRQLRLEHRHFGEFRVPPLRQLVHTAPYFHDGSRATIEAVVQHYSALDEERLHADGERILRRLDLSADEAADLAAFLRSLSSTALPRR
jgi:cytochrome c peroxidase